MLGADCHNDLSLSSLDLLFYSPSSYFYFPFSMSHLLCHSFSFLSPFFHYSFNAMFICGSLLKFFCFGRTYVAAILPWNIFSSHNAWLICCIMICPFPVWVYLMDNFYVLMSGSNKWYLCCIHLWHSGQILSYMQCFLNLIFKIRCAFLWLCCYFSYYLSLIKCLFCAVPLHCWMLFSFAVKFFIVSTYSLWNRILWDL